MESVILQSLGRQEDELPQTKMFIKSFERSGIPEAELSTRAKLFEARLAVRECVDLRLINPNHAAEMYAQIYDTMDR